METRYGRLVLTGDRAGSLVECVCDCGTVKMVRKSFLKSGAVKSCGCLMRSAGITHGMSATRTYACWKNMINRVMRPSSKKYYPAYFNRHVHPSWTSFESFYRDMGNCPPNHSLDRIDNTKGYFKENCRWATQQQQMHNTSRNRIVSVCGVEVTFTRLIRVSGINRNTAWKRLLAGWPPISACFAPLKTRRRSAINPQNVAGWTPPDIEALLRKQGWEGE